MNLLPSLLPDSMTLRQHTPGFRSHAHVRFGPLAAASGISFYNLWGSISTHQANGLSAGSMKQAIDKFIDYLQYERNASPETLGDYRGDLMRFREFLTPPGEKT